MMHQRVTIADVAREAHVSLMTVSRVINDKDGISQATRQRVQDVIDRLGYRPSKIARGLATQRTGTLGLVVPDNSNPFFSEVARGVEHAAYAEDYNVFLCNTEEDTQREEAVLESLAEKRVDGLVLCSPRLDDQALLAAIKDFPSTVLINRVLPGSATAALRLDNQEGAKSGVQHLLRRGHRRIGLLAGPLKSFGGQYRALGYQDALEEAGIGYNPDWIQHCTPMVDTGQEAAVELLTRCPELTALFCFNDLIAIGALKACAQLGRAVPEDVAIVGFDDIPLASLVTPPLTTFHVSRYELGRRAAEHLLAQINGEANHTDTVIPVELVIRASAP
jgi:LacI family transcriptional regulator